MLSRRGQMLQFIWMFSVLVLVNVLYGQFKGVLMVQVQNGFLRTVQDLAKSPHIIPSLSRDTINEYIFKPKDWALMPQCRTTKPTKNQLRMDRFWDTVNKCNSPGCCCLNTELVDFSWVVVGKSK